MKEVFNEKGYFIGRVRDESVLWEFEYEEYDGVIVILDTTPEIEEYLKMYVLHNQEDRNGYQSTFYNQIVL